MRTSEGCKHFELTLCASIICGIIASAYQDKRFCRTQSYKLRRMVWMNISNGAKVEDNDNENLLEHNSHELADHVSRESDTS